MESYGKRLRRAARQEFKHFWSFYRYWAVIAPTIVVPIALQILRHGVRSLVNLGETLENAIAGLVLSIVGTYLVAMRHGAENLDRELHADICTKEGIIKSLEKGVWYRSMFGHSGWCATLEDWFDPRRTRDDYVPTGFKPFAAKTYAVKGHPFGLDLNAQDKRALIAFLNTL